MANKIVWFVFFIVSCLLLVFYLQYPPHNNGGDMVEYFGMTESLINHQSINLTPQDFENLKKYLSPGYFKFQQEFEETKGGFMAYVDGKDGLKYSLHFWFYSLLATPIRVILRLFGNNELNCLRITNFLIFTASVFFILKRYVKKLSRRIIFLGSLYLSPLIFFIIYPGVDIYNTMFFLVGIFAFFNKDILLAAFLTTLASWHSQPLIIPAWAIIGYYIFHNLNFKNNKFQVKDLFVPLIIIIISLIPYFSNYYLFGMWSPWNIINDGWTQIYGFGLQNFSLKRLFEQFFDLNMGLFWYAPALMIIGLYYIVKLSVKKIWYLLVLGVVIITAFAYQTNPAWHYGTAGFAPTRHVLYFIPVLIYFVTTYFTINIKSVVLLIIPFILQLYALTYNSFLTPTFFNSLSHNQYAQYVLNYFPKFYNPTPKIFVDRTTHTDKKFLTTAIYKFHDKCKKAFVVQTDKNLLIKECEYIPAEYQGKLDDEFGKKVDYSREVYIAGAIFLADPSNCMYRHSSSSATSSKCIYSIDDFIKFIGIDPNERTRITQLKEYEGTWKIEKGDVIKVKVPPGYILDYQSLNGIYINY